MAEQCNAQVFEADLKNEDNLKNEDILKNEVDHRNDDDLRVGVTKKNGKIWDKFQKGGGEQKTDENSQFQFWNLKNYETYNRSARVLFSNKSLSSNIKQFSNKF